MTLSEIIKEINRLPNYLYEYCADDGIHRVILGGHSCQKKDQYDNLSFCARYLRDMTELYQKENLTDEDKASMAKQMKRIMNQCDYRHSELYSLEQQEKYLSKLDTESIQEISKQVLMYKTAREYYRDYVYNK